MSSSTLQMDGVSHAFGPVDVLSDLRIKVRRGEFLAVVGPSGCGKTTLLGLLAGEFPATAGQVLRSGHTRRVYQHGGLLPWLTAAGNISLGLGRAAGAKERTHQTAEPLTLIPLEGFDDHYPYQLSGGMRRERVSMLHLRPRTVVFVTHDIAEAAQLAERVLVLSERPARITCELRIDLPQPRPLTNPEVVPAVERILHELGLDEDGV